MPTTLPPLALTLGDPAGIGPELACAAWLERGAAQLAPFFVVGSISVLAGAARTRGWDLPLLAIGEPADAAGCFGDVLPVLDIAGLDYAPGAPSKAGAELAFQSLEIAAGLVRGGAASALVTAPVAKSELAAVGFSHPGQTEYVAERCGIAAHNAVMMLAGPSLRVVPITVHAALAEVPRLLTAELIRARTAIAAAALVRDFGIERPRIAVAGLNPHAGENGRFGREEIDTIAPAVAQLRAEGIDASGPLAADGMFHAEARAHYDLAVCMYHDQALIPLKALDFDHGVNVTLGLPIVRTSPDHGTAFAIAGTGRARVGPTLAAIRMAGDCAARRAAA
ncbi:4-hydroxythreonine-4-phosphate dehydrogenase PdxA [Novosphingobium sp. Gsoil 351]|uniref:4-hydroxythreonine-4-phosphate dehydrogenase PdxA n=1 Tax=Novosphingobium sp. Gsoil 351 TaxID=2675225 RepID=UPI0012B468CC|nr:4-hydroxythreonine-4-phosphate dehydrogenase PdxA [Novosphingobium sp. Gsoil 351]QGN53698.1 4-hydroxythreonine-4-phosphate dehydrogenase PdxA [Novosphingobium sp. Gsoil 351]